MSDRDDRTHPQPLPLPAESSGKWVVAVIGGALALVVVAAFGVGLGVRRAHLVTWSAVEPARSARPAASPAESASAAPAR